jgi:DNA-binding NarL/FixJ family response regulator
MRVVIADDSILVREGIATILGRAGIEVAAQASGPDELLRDVAEHGPDVAIVDIRMPPTFTDEGLRAAHAIRARHPRIGIVILSQHVEVGTAMQLLAEQPERLGYLLKDRVGDIDEFAGSLRRVAAGGTALDAEIVSCLLGGTDDEGPLASLSAREREVLALVAEGRSNRGIGDRLTISDRAVQKHVTAIFGKLALPADDDDNRRILAVLAYLRPLAAAGR